MPTFETKCAHRISVLLPTIALSGILILTGCTSSAPVATPPPSGNTVPPTSAPPSPTPTVTPSAGVSVVTVNRDAPWSVAFLRETPLISERDSARVFELDPQGQARLVATIEGVSPHGEGGLLGIAVYGHVLYTYFTAANDNRVVRYPLLGEPGSLRLGAPTVILTGIPKARNHNGGRIAFGPDGMLYVTTGDAADRSHSQDLNSLAGKILRMTPTGEIPADNPFKDSFVYSYGHRNPQGIAWDDNGTMYASEFGQNTWDELNVIQPGGNYGWPRVEGIAGVKGYIDPVQQWRPSDASPSGIAIADGSIWIANLRGQRLREVPLDDLTTSIEHWVGKYGRLRDAVLTPSGAIWVLTNNTDGRGNSKRGDDRILQFYPPLVENTP